MEDFWNLDERAWKQARQEERQCDAPGCRCAGEHRAPKSRDGAQGYYFFCLDHVRDYNRQWDYFDGMGRADIESFMREAETGHRPTWKTAERAAPTPEKLHEALRRMFGEGGARRRKAESPPRGDIDPRLHQALAVLDMDYPVTLRELKRQYKQLVKKHHPDAARGGRRSEEIFKRVTEAYRQASAMLRREER